MGINSCRYRLSFAYLALSILVSPPERNGCDSRNTIMAFVYEVSPTGRDHNGARIGHGLIFRNLFKNNL